MLAIVLGFVLGAADVGRAQVARAPVFAALRDALAAATRLNAVGPLAAARLHAKLAPAAEALTAAVELAVPTRLSGKQPKKVTLQDFWPGAPIKVLKSAVGKKCLA